MFSFSMSNSSGRQETLNQKSDLTIADYENDENCNDINIGKRSKLSKTASTNFSFPSLPKEERKEVEELVKHLQSELQIKESMISNLGIQQFILIKIFAKSKRSYHNAF